MTDNKITRQDKKENSDDNIIIRCYESRDRNALRQICLDTAYFGQTYANFFADGELLADLIMNYYVDYEPQHTWVAEYNGEVIGYLSACFDETAYSRNMLFNVLPGSILRALKRGRIWDKRTSRLLLYNLKSAFKRESSLKKINEKEFPVHIHQNMKDGFRGKGIGSRLVERFLEEAKNARTAGIRFRALRQQPQFSFFEKYGFIKIDCKRVNTWERWLNKQPLFFMEYVKKLDRTCPGIPSKDSWISSKQQ